MTLQAIVAPGLRRSMERPACEVAGREKPAPAGGNSGGALGGRTGEPHSWRLGERLVAARSLDCPRRLWYDALFASLGNIAIRSAPSPSGKAEVCKTSIPGSNPGGASNLRSMILAMGERVRGARFQPPLVCQIPVLASVSRPREVSTMLTSTTRRYSMFRVHPLTRRADSAVRRRRFRRTCLYARPASNRVRSITRFGSGFGIVAGTVATSSAFSTQRNVAICPGTAFTRTGCLVFDTVYKAARSPRRHILTSSTRTTIVLYTPLCLRRPGREPSQATAQAPASIVSSRWQRQAR